MLDKDISEWSLGDIQKVYLHFGEDFVCYSRDQSAPIAASSSLEEISEAMISMPSRSVKCHVVLDGKLTHLEEEDQWVAYRKDGALLVSERIDAPKEEVLFKISKVELALKRNNAFSVAVCDDNKDLADSLGDFLCDYGFSTSVFYTVTDVEKAVADKVFDAFVLDWSIGNQTSESLIRLIRLAKSPTVPIFLITGNLTQGLSTEDEIAEIVRNYHILPRDKPIRPSILAAEILSAIQFSNEGAKPKPTNNATRY